MLLKTLPAEFSVCKLPDLSQVAFQDEFLFLGKTDEELSLVCAASSVPQNALIREDGWRALRVDGTLDFSLVGILSTLSAVLAENKIAVFAVSTYNTDYLLVRSADLERALSALAAAGHQILQPEPAARER